MNILLVTATYYPTVNGVSFYIKTLKKELEKNGHKVFVLAPSFPGFKDMEKNIIRYPSLPNPLVKRYPLGVPIVLMSKLQKLKIDVVHVQHPLVIGKFAVSAAEKLGITLFFTAHTNYEQYLNYYFPKGYFLASKFILNDIKNLATKCQTVICPSSETQTRLKNHGVKNTTLMLNSVDTEVFSPIKKPKSEIFRIIYVGRIEKEKNPLFLIDIARELKKRKFKFEMLIVGTGNLWAKLSQRISKLKLEDEVKLGGEVPNQVLPILYNSADIFFTPSTSEVMPITILESLACGVPVGVLKNSNLESIITNNLNGIVVPNKVGAVAEEIIKLASDKKLLNKMSKNARLEALKHSVTTYARDLIKIYKADN
ncbi:MAG: Glycosyl transferase, group 1 family protein [Microgenomates group bacterium GW2011_GWC1_37_12b]|nr:MAG: Glycosyl transferase, group 1 family protein [Microgenomates group bacterium GW2011_GWC1_37_12b]KKQ87562.1 MAG: Glycosyl transferase, group 1 family protein [Candidatus Woesebacteria bacterium GW2011_GWB1_38_8b]